MCNGETIVREYVFYTYYSENKRLYPRLFHQPINSYWLGYLSKWMCTMLNRICIKPYWFRLWCFMPIILLKYSFLKQISALRILTFLLSTLLGVLSVTLNFCDAEKCWDTRLYFVIHTVFPMVFILDRNYLWFPT